VDLITHVIVVGEKRSREIEEMVKLAKKKRGKIRTILGERRRM
jgi:hypothetical protein